MVRHGLVLALAVVAFVSVLLTAAEESVFQRAPYLVMTAHPETEITLRWRLTAAETSVARWGTTTTYTTGQATVPEMTSDHTCTLTLRGLLAGTQYFYAISAGNEVKTGSFRTSPSTAADSLVFYGIGDPQVAPCDDRFFPDVCGFMLQDVLKLPAERQTFCVVTGDWMLPSACISYALNYVNAYSTPRPHLPAPDSPERVDLWWDEWFTRAAGLPAALPFVGCVGNHDADQGEPETMLAFPRNWPFPYVGGAYWSFSWGPAHFVVVDEYSPLESGTEQRRWLEAELRASRTAPWTIIVLHNAPVAPPRALGQTEPDRSSLYADGIIGPLAVEYGVDLVLAGNSHCHSLWRLPEPHGTGVPVLVMAGAASYELVRNILCRPAYYRFSIAGASMRIEAELFDALGQSVEKVETLEIGQR